MKIYRFNDQVAMHFEGQPTVYLNIDDAQELKWALNKFITDIRMRSFQDSHLSSVYIGNNHDSNN